MSRTRALAALRVTGGCRRGANFHAGIDRAGAAGLCVEHGFGFRLGFFEFQFLAVILAFGGSAFSRMRFTRLGERRVMNLGNHFAGFAVQVSGTSLGLLFEFVVTFVGRGFVMDGVGFFFVDGLLFHGAGGGEYGGF
jgi:hypothetical protein